MEKTLKLLQKVLSLLIMTVAVAACSSNGDFTEDDGNVKPDANVSDPTGTVSLSMMSGKSTYEGATKLGESYIYIREDYNFSGGDFVSLGTVNGLGNVSNIPTTGWAGQVSVRSGNGYVAYSRGDFYRIFVDKEIVGTTGGVIGYDVKYQTPFKGKDIELDVPATTLSFDKKGGTESIVFNNKEFVIFSAKSSEYWCHFSTTSTYNWPFLANGIQIIVDPSDVVETTEATITLTTAYGKEKEIKVMRGGVDPTISFEETSVNLDAGKCSRKIGINTNIQKENLEINNTASSWCKAEFVDQARAIRSNAAKIKFVGNKPAKVANASGTAKSYALMIEADANDKETVREGTITLKSKDGKKSAILNVTQKKGYLYVTNEEFDQMTVNYNDGKNSIGNVYSSLSYEELQVSSNATWCIPTLVEGYYHSFYLAVNVSKNATDKSREAKIVLSNKSKTISKTLTVIQNGFRFIPRQTKVGFDKTQSNKTIAIDTSFDWEATSNQSWCTVSKNGNNLTIRVTAYSGSAANRKATISFKGLSTKIEVEQSKYVVGDQYNENGVKGEVAYMNDTLRYVIKEVGKAAWSTENVETGAIYVDDGMKNMAIIKKIPGWKNYYPAFALCDNLNSESVTGWYLPATKELDIIGYIGWSSTEYSSTHAYFHSRDHNKKENIYTVRAVHRF